MKLSKLVNNPVITSATIEVRDRVKTTIFYNARSRRTKWFKSLEIDMEVQEKSIASVKHNGVKRYLFYKDTNLYINIYFYN